MFSFTRLIANIIPLGFVSAIYFGFIGEIPLSEYGNVNVLPSYSIVFFIALAFILITDFIIIGIPGIGVVWLAFILSSLALQNWISGLMAGIASLILGRLLGIGLFSTD